MDDPKFMSLKHPEKSFALLLLAFFCASSTGCLHRRMTISSDPSGAMVMLEGNEVGYTPVSVDFKYYGTREITLLKDGYETVKVMQKVSIPWYQIVPLDFVSDNLVPFRVTDRHGFHYRMQPRRHVSQEELLNNANNLRSESRGGQ